MDVEAREETVTLLADAVRRFVRERLLPAEPEVEDHDRIPAPLIAQLKALGLFGMTIPEQYGGLGLSMYEEARVVFEIGYASPVSAPTRHQQRRRHAWHPARRHRGTARALPAADRQGGDARVFLPDRT